ncbi:hypothetical protein MMC06_001255 [Schaereria dolodes]|nr:hypothetical protein [Schaereria dolodes]
MALVTAAATAVGTTVTAAYLDAKFSLSKDIQQLWRLRKVGKETIRAGMIERTIIPVELLKFTLTSGLLQVLEVVLLLSIFLRPLCLPIRGQSLFGHEQAFTLGNKFMTALVNMPHFFCLWV